MLIWHHHNFRWMNLEVKMRTSLDNDSSPVSNSNSNIFPVNIFLNSNRYPNLRFVMMQCWLVMCKKNHKLAKFSFSGICMHQIKSLHLNSISFHFYSTTFSLLNIYTSPSFLFPGSNVSILGDQGRPLDFQGFYSRSFFLDPFLVSITLKTS